MFLLQIDASSCASDLQEFTEKYPGNYDVQLKRLAEYFETKFGKASLGPAKLMEEKTFSRKLGALSSRLLSVGNSTVPTEKPVLV